MTTFCSATLWTFFCNALGSKRVKTICFHFGDDQPALHQNAELHELAASIVSNNHKRCYYPAIFKFLREDAKSSC